MIDLAFTSESSELNWAILLKLVEPSQVSLFNRGVLNYSKKTSKKNAELEMS